jgi:hypothetical protein
LTCRGTERVANLSVSDHVLALRGEKPIQWIGRQHLDNAPNANLHLSPTHALFIDEVLIEVKDLVNGGTITRATPAGMKDIEYFHIELETHEVIFAEGAAVETLLVTDGRESFSNFVEHERLGRQVGQAMMPYAPVLRYSTARAHLNALLRLGISQVVDVRDLIQVVYDRIAARASKSCLSV